MVFQGISRAAVYPDVVQLILLPACSLFRFRQSQGIDPMVLQRLYREMNPRLTEATNAAAT